MAPHKKKASRLGAHIVFIDESGFLLIPPVRKTWAPRGKTPVLRHHQLRNRVSAISGISVSSKTRRLGLYFTLFSKNIQQDEVCEFLRHILRHLKGRVIVIWDNAKIHKGEVIREFCRSYNRLHLEAFPPYAPELNPVEGVWSEAKNDLGNGSPENIEELKENVGDALEKIKPIQSHLRAAIYRSALPPFLC
jgi:putative transposase